MSSELEIVESSFHPTASGGCFVAVVDDRRDGLAKLVVCFAEDVLVLGLDTLINEEDISAEAHGHQGARWDAVREALWNEHT